jgi:hypothetical protein
LSSQSSSVFSSDVSSDDSNPIPSTVLQYMQLQGRHMYTFIKTPDNAM